MKKTLLLLAMLLVSVASFAQWKAPVPSKVQEMATDGTTQFLYNKEAGGFFAGGNDWNTRASITANADSIKFVEADGDNFNFMCFPNAANKGKWLYVSCNSYDAMWVDAPNADSNNDYPGTDSWQVKKNANGTYSISNTLYDGKLGIAEFYRGLAGNTRTYINDPIDQYEENEEAVPSVSGAFYDEWYFIDEEEVNALKPQVEAYLASVNLKGAISQVKAQDASYDLSVLNAIYNNTSSTKEELDAATAVANAVVDFSQALATAKQTYPSLDFSAPVAVYNNPSSTKEELAAAKNQIQEIINNYLATQASFDKPIDFEKTIGNGSDVGPWTREFTGDGEIGTWHTNTWSTEANGGGDGTDMTTPFCEDWVANGSILSDQKIYQVLAGAAPGLYKFSANVRLYNEKGDQDALTGCTMYFGDNTVTLDEQVKMYKSGGKCVLWKEGGFSIIAIVKEAGDIEFGFDIKGATFNWMAFKETSLKYYGNEDVEANALLLIKGDDVYEKYEDGEAYQGLIDAYNAAVDAYDAAATADEINAAVANIKEAKAELDENIQAYKNLNAKIEEWDALVGKNNDLVGAEWDDFTDFMMGEEIEGYPTPAIPEIEYSLTTEEIQKYIEDVEALYSAAVAACIRPGADCTHMLTNPGFTDPNGKGWTVGGNCNNKALTGGFIPTAAHPNAGFPVAESWHSTFDIYQEVSGVQDGIYSLSLNGFCRLDDGVDSEVPAFIYMNEFATRLMNIQEDKISKDEAIDGFNCYLTTASDGPWSTNPIFEGAKSQSPANNTDSDSGDGYYWPNGMEGASVAFSAGRYEAKVYGLVEGGKMRIGIRNLTSTHVWALWSNFKLTYEGKSEEALNSILPLYVEKLATYVDENNLTTPVIEEANKAIAAGDDAADVDEKYDALIAINKALNDAMENAAALKDYDASYTALVDAANSSSNTAAVDEYNEKIDSFSSVEELETAAIRDMIADMDVLAARLAIPSVEGASDDNAIDMTSVIKNPDFQENAAQEQANGWTLVKGETAQGNYQVQNDFDGVGMEFWSNTQGEGTQYDFYQVIKYLPAGTYVLTVDASNSLNGQEAGVGEGAAYIYAGAGTDGNFRTVLSDPIAIQEEGCNDNYNNYEVVINLKEGEDLIIGSKNIGQLSARWVMVDNFKLSYLGTESTREESTPEDATAIMSVAPIASPAAIYSLSGTRMNTLQKGLNIVRTADGSVKKIMVK